MRVDTQSHLLPEWSLEHPGRRKRSPRVAGRGKGRFIQVGAWQGKFGPKVTSLGAKRRDMNAAAVDVTVLSAQFPGPELLAEEGLDLVERAGRSAADKAKIYGEDARGLFRIGRRLRPQERPGRVRIGGRIRMMPDGYAEMVSAISSAAKVVPAI